MLLEVKDFCSFADYFIICSGGSRRHVLALAQYIEEALAQAKIKPLGVEGLSEGQWVLMDYNAVVIHIFLEPLREFYNLEGLWVEAPKTLIDTAAPAFSDSAAKSNFTPNQPPAPGNLSHE